MQATMTARPVPTDAERQLYHQVVYLYAHHDPSVDIGRAWQAVSSVQADPDLVADALYTCLDWTKGKPYAPEWFPADFQQQWRKVVEMDLMDDEEARADYRRERGLPD